jgi:hypothetical protein
MRIIKAGILDDVNVINNTKPGAELFVSSPVHRAVSSTLGVFVRCFTMRSETGLLASATSALPSAHVFQVATGLAMCNFGRS